MFYSTFRKSVRRYCGIVKILPLLAVLVGSGSYAASPNAGGVAQAPMNSNEYTRKKLEEQRLRREETRRKMEDARQRVNREGRVRKGEAGEQTSVATEAKTAQKEKAMARMKLSSKIADVSLKVNDLQHKVKVKKEELARMSQVPEKKPEISGQPAGSLLRSGANTLRGRVETSGAPAQSREKLEAEYNEAVRQLDAAQNELDALMKQLNALQ
ncbi:MAG: hypothetical protein MJ016_01900 [Victivallaceae bacterium]|nr:hypothetical protein [Victivallaceae bacterium]